MFCNKFVPKLCSKSLKTNVEGVHIHYSCGYSICNFTKSYTPANVIFNDLLKTKNKAAVLSNTFHTRIHSSAHCKPWKEQKLYALCFFWNGNVFVRAILLWCKTVIKLEKTYRMIIHFPLHSLPLFQKDDSISFVFCSIKTTTISRSLNVYGWNECCIYVLKKNRTWEK